MHDANMISSYFTRNVISIRTFFADLEQIFVVEQQTNFHNSCVYLMLYQMFPIS